MPLLARDTKVTGPFAEGLMLLESFHGSEMLGMPYSYSLTLLSEKSDIEPKDLLGQTLTVHLTLDTGEVRYFDGVVTHFAKTGFSVRYTRYAAVLDPTLSLFKHTRDCRIYFDAVA